MVDINKYLQAQLALAQQKCETKNLNNRKSVVSERSAVAAEIISKKQNKKFNKGKSSNSDVDTVSHKPNTTHKEQKSDDDSDYIPSCEEDDEDITLPSTSISANRRNVKKIIDDGDTKLYQERLQKWKKALKLARSGEFDGPVTSADIQYATSGNSDVKDLHELQNGFSVPNYIWKQLYKYQRTGVKWLWELHQLKSGGLLGDEMGLGKTVQIIGFLAGLSKSEIGSWSGLGPTIIVAPATVMYQWVSHFHYWCPYLRVAVLHHSGSHAGNHDRLLRDVYNDHGILLITYAGIVKYNKDLICRNWHYVILDEGHKIRNPDTQVSKLIRKYPTCHRLIVTGSPMQNSLMELWSLFDFMRPGLLGTQNAFMDYFAFPITQGGYTNATDFQEAAALEIAKALKNLITPYLLRRTKAQVQEHIKLPEKSEQVLFCALSQEQRDLYMGYLTSQTVRSILDRDFRYGDPLRARILVALGTLRKICNHPDLYLYEAHESTQEIDEKFGHWKRSGKMTVVHSLLKIWQKQGHRALIFTQSRAMIYIIESFLQSHGYKYLRMDGTVSVSHRQSLIKNFNDNSEYLVFLATTRVGGLGINLTGADRVIIYDPDWNPATDTQAKERAWRIGQLRNVTVYRLLSAGTIEEKIYQRQIFKQLLTNKVLLDPNQRNILKTSTLQGLFSLEEPNCEGDTETSSIFKHTKVNLKLNHKDYAKNDIHLSGGVSLSETKLEAMRKMAREISKKISQNVAKPVAIVEDPRERYKRKREILLNHPKVEEPKVNLIDDQATNVPFETVLSEIDIINIHIKRNYEENLINGVFQTQQNEEETVAIETDKILKLTMEKDSMAIEVDQLLQITNENDIVTIEDDELSELTKEKDTPIETDEMLELSEEKANELEIPGTSSNKKDSERYRKNKKSSKRRHFSKEDIEQLVAIKKVKKTKMKEHDNDDDYVLSKLFAKSTVQNALQHDEIVGLAEKEKKYKLKEEAARKARDALRAIKCSTK